MKLNFQKMHLLGNDFVITETIRQAFTPTPALIKSWADRKTGIGFDQFLLIEKPCQQNTHFHYRIFNADGQEVSQCGNGALCVAQFLLTEQLTTANPIRLTTKNSQLVLQLTKKGQVTATLGIPIIKTNDLNSPLHHLSTPLGSVDAYILSLGNPHCVLPVQQLDTAPVAYLGQYFNQPPQSLFPTGTNVAFVEITTPQQIKLRVYERGAGETRACGSGACAAVIAGRLMKQLDSQVNVQLPGGTLTVCWPGPNQAVSLTGQGTQVFQGTIRPLT